MKLKSVIVVLFLSVSFVNCTIEDEDEDFEFVRQIEGKWDLYSIKFQFEDEEIITSCDETTWSEFTFNSTSDTYFGDYEGTTYFFFETLPECAPETFTGSWEWDSTSGGGPDGNIEWFYFDFNMTLISSGTSLNYENRFTASFETITNFNGVAEDHLTLIFRNEDEDEDESRVYKFLRIE